MVRKRIQKETTPVEIAREFHLDFLHPSQEFAWKQYQRHELLFLLGPAGCGKTFLATAFAIHDLLQKKIERIVITRPIVEAGESLGFLPGEMAEKVAPYMRPIYDCIRQIAGKNNPDVERVKHALDVIPLAYMRGITVQNAVFILDEAQNCTYDQLKLAITRLGKNSKMIITADPEQSDLGGQTVAVEDVVAKISPVTGVGVMRFKESDIVRHPLLAKILKRL